MSFSQSTTVKNSHLMACKPEVNIWEVRKAKMAKKYRQMAKEEEERQAREKVLFKQRVKRKEAVMRRIPGTFFVRHFLDQVKELEVEEKDRKLQKMIPLMLSTTGLAEDIEIDLEERRWCRDAGRCQDDRVGHLVHWKHWE